MQEKQVQSLSQEDPLEEEMVTHSSILAWKIPWTEIVLNINISNVHGGQTAAASRSAALKVRRRVTKHWVAESD